MSEVVPPPPAPAQGSPSNSQSLNGIPIVQDQSIQQSSQPVTQPPSSTPLKNFPDYLHDHFDAVYKRVTFGRRDLKAVKSYFDIRGEAEKNYAKLITKDANLPDLTDSSSLGSVWQSLKESALATAQAHTALSVTCAELSGQFEKLIKEIKQAKTTLESRYKKISADQAGKQKAHDKSRDAYGDAVRHAEQSINQREGGRALPAAKQQPLENALQRSLSNLNSKHDEYKKSVQALKESQTNYDTTMIDMMNQFESLETARLQTAAAYFERWVNQHDAYNQSINQVVASLHRSCAGVNTQRDLQEYIGTTTTHTKPRPHIEYHAIDSPIIEQWRQRMSGGTPPLQAPPVQQAFTQSPAPVQQAFAPQAPPQTMQPQSIQPQTQVMQAQPSAMVPTAGVAKFIPAPVAGPFIPPAVPAALQAIALYDFDSVEPDDLPFKQGDVIMLRQFDETEDWWNGELNGRAGIFPKTYVQLTTAAEPVSAPPMQHFVAESEKVVIPLTSSAPISPVEIEGSSSAPPANAAAGAAQGEFPREMSARCEALFDFVGQDVDELSFKKGDMLQITGELNGWYLGKIEGTETIGIFPSNYCSLTS